MSSTELVSDDAPEQSELPMFVAPTHGERITSNVTGNTYWIGLRLGEGHFGVVYEGKDTWGNELAIKVLKPSGTYEAVRSAAIAEFQKLTQLRHPNITYIHDAFEYRHTFYIVVERCSHPISHILNRDKFKGEVWLMPIARCMLQALHFIHLSGYAHQDIHSGNVFVSWVNDEMVPDTSVCTFKVGDLGIAKLVSEMNAENTVLADWMRAPEAIDHAEFGPMDHRMDIYHCGLLFLQLIKGEPLTYTREEVLAGLPRQEALLLEQPYRFALEKALRRHAVFRTATAMEFWRDLNSPSDAQ